MSVATAWDIRNEGRDWSAEEAIPRYYMKPHKIELVKGRLLDQTEDRETLLCLLLENVGADRVVQFGTPQVWRDAIAKLGNE